MKRVLVAILTSMITLSLAPAARAHPCADAAQATYPTAPILDGLEGRYSYPDGTPIGIVVFAHGYRNRSSSWEPHLLEAAERGLVAVAMDYRGTGPAPENRGWPVRAGAEDSIAAALHFLATCDLPADVPIALFGISMGGNVSGYAVASQPTRPDGAPLFDHWIAVEGALNSLETYLSARALAPADPYAGGAAEDFEAECAGAFEEQPGCYLDMSIVARTLDVAGSGVRGVVLVHGLADGLVPYNQSRELATTLRAAGMPTDVFTVLRRNDWQNPDSASDEGGTTIDSYASPVTGPAGADIRPLAGHGWEGSTTHVVIRTGLDRLWLLLDPDDPETPSGQEYLVDGEAGIIPLL